MTTRLYIDVQYADDKPSPTGGITKVAVFGPFTARAEAERCATALAGRVDVVGATIREIVDR